MMHKIKQHLHRTISRAIEYKLFFAIVILLLIIDQVIKSIVVANAQFLQSPIPLIPGLLFLLKVTNTGVAFGLLDSFQIVVQIITGIIIIASVYFLSRFPKSFIIPLSFVIGGALGNFVDRLAYGHVIDYIFLRYFSVFNFADMCITFGIVWLMYLELFNKEDIKTTPADAATYDVQNKASEKTQSKKDKKHVQKSSQKSFQRKKSK
jgi:signal peptidase II